MLQIQNYADFIQNTLDSNRGAVNRERDRAARRHANGLDVDVAARFPPGSKMCAISETTRSFTI